MNLLSYSDLSAKDPSALRDELGAEATNRSVFRDIWASFGILWEDEVAVLGFRATIRSMGLVQR